MKQFAGFYGTDVAFTSSEHFAKGVAITVLDEDGVTLSDLWTDHLRTAVRANPITTALVTGEYEFYAEPGVHVLLGSGGFTATVLVPNWKDEPPNAGQVTEAMLAFTVGTQAEVDAEEAARIAADAAHTADTTGIHGIVDTAALDTIVARDAAIAALVDSSPATLDTLNELAAALADDPNFATTMTNALAARVLKAGDTSTGEQVAPSFQASGKTGATATPMILGGGTASGAPTTGAHLKGELVTDDAGDIWRCTVAGTPGTWIKAGSGTFVAPKALRLNGSRMLVAGDSQSTLGIDNVVGESYTVWLAWQSEGRIKEVARTATSGNTSADQLTAIRAVIAAGTVLPTMCTLMIGTNDLSGAGGSTKASWQANITAITTELRAAGCETVLFTLPPRSGPTTPIAPAIVDGEWNNWLRKYARENGYALVDAWRVVANPATGEYRTGWFNTADGVHMNATAHRAVADEALWVLDEILLPAHTILPVTLFDGSRFDDGVFVAAGAVPGTWTQVNVAAGTTLTVVSDSLAPGGFAVELDSLAPAASNTGLMQRVWENQSDFTNGDRLLLVVMFRIVSAVGITATTVAAGIRWSLVEDNASPATTVSNVGFGQHTPTDDYMVALYEFTPTDATTSIQCHWQYIKGNSGGSDHIVARLAAMGVYNLTALGLV